MAKYTVYVTLPLVGCKMSTTVKVEGEMPIEDLEDLLEEAAFEMFDWHYVKEGDE